MNRKLSTKLLLSIVILISVTSISLHGQTASEIFEMDRGQRNEESKKGVIKAFLEVCMNSGDATSSICTEAVNIIYEAKTIEELYELGIKEDQSFKDALASRNQFDIRKKRQEIANNAESIKQEIFNLKGEYKAIGEITLYSSQYDFENELLKFKPRVQEGGSGIEIKILHPKSEETYEAEIKIPVNKAEELFNNTYNSISGLWILTYTNATQKSTSTVKAEVKKMELVDLKTGNIIWESEY
tara:strand:+ start:99224 stop:99949 length:726 start_codon:yes stop_codon:yes gene_type:complete